MTFPTQKLSFDLKWNTTISALSYLNNSTGQNVTSFHLNKRYPLLHFELLPALVPPPPAHSATSESRCAIGFLCVQQTSLYRWLCHSRCVEFSTTWQVPTDLLHRPLLPIEKVDARGKSLLHLAYEIPHFSKRFLAKPYEISDFL